MNQLQTKLFWYFEAFSPEIDKKTSLKGLKNWLSQKEVKNNPESYFQWILNKANPEERFRYDGNNFFVQTSEKGQIFLKTVSSSKWVTYSKT